MDGGEAAPLTVSALAPIEMLRLPWIAVGCDSASGGATEFANHSGERDPVDEDYVDALRRMKRVEGCELGCRLSWVGELYYI